MKTQLFFRASWTLFISIILEAYATAQYYVRDQRGIYVVLECKNVLPIDQNWKYFSGITPLNPVPGITMISYCPHVVYSMKPTHFIEKLASPLNTVNCLQQIHW
jgi:hypothetical protein